VVLRFQLELVFFVGSWEFLLSMAWRQGRSPNGYAVVFDSIESCVLFSSIWCVCVCVVARHMMTLWQGSCQMKGIRQKSRRIAAKGCAALKINNVALVFCDRKVVEVWVFRSLF